MTLLLRFCSFSLSPPPSAFSTLSFSFHFSFRFLKSFLSISALFLFFILRKEGILMRIKKERDFNPISSPTRHDAELLRRTHEKSQRSGWDSPCYPISVPEMPFILSLFSIPLTYENFSGNSGKSQVVCAEQLIEQFSWMLYAFFIFLAVFFLTSRVINIEKTCAQHVVRGA